MNKFRTIITWVLLLAVNHVMGYTITVDPIEIEAGKSANLVINLSNTETNLTAYQMFLYLPSGVTLQKKSNGKYAYTANASRHDGEFTFSVKDAADGSVLISCFSADKDVLTVSSGELIRLPVDVASTVTTSLQGSIKSIEFTDVNAQGHKIENVNFTMTMEGSTQPTVSDEVTISVPNSKITAGGSTELIVNMETAKTNLTAYQMFLYLPSGVTLQKKSNGKYAYTANASRHDGEFTISVKDAADGSILISCFSADKDVLTGSSGELIRLPVDVASTVTTSLQGSIKNIEVTDLATQGYRLADVSFNMILAGGGNEQRFIVNGDMEGDDVSCFFSKEPNDTDPVPSTIVDGVGKDGSRCIVVNSGDNPAHNWDSQFYVRLTKPLPAGTRYRLKFDYKASQDNVEVWTEAHQEPAEFIEMYPISSLIFGTDWKTYDETGVISNTFSPTDNMQTITFDLAISESATTYYFDNFLFEIDNRPFATVTVLPEGKTLTYTGEVQKLAIAGACENGTMLYSLDGDTFSEEIPTAKEPGEYTIYYKALANEGHIDSKTYTIKARILPAHMENLVVNGDMESNDVTCFFSRENMIESEDVVPSTIVDGAGKDGSRCIVINSVDNPVEDWNTEFYVRLPKPLPAGVIYHVKFDYKASQKAEVGTVIESEPSEYIYWDGIGSINFTTEWQTYEHVGVITADQSPDYNMQTIAFQLAKLKSAASYYFDNIVFEIDANQPIPFANADVKALCVSNWDTNGDGELGFAEAAAVTNEQFADLSFESVTADSWTFDELQYFTGLTVLNSKLAETKISSVKIPVTVTEIGENAFRKTLLTSITLPDAVKKVGEGAFAECGELVTANLGRVEEIGVIAFISTSIVNLTLPGTVKTVGLEPFSWNWTMKQATLEEGVTKVPETMFHGNVNLTTVSLPSTLTTIEQRAFQQCEALTTISIPESVTTIDVQAFNNCTSLVEVTVANPTPVEITEEVFSNRKNATLYVPDGCVAAYRAADYWKEFKKILVVGTTDPVNETDISQMPNAIYMEPVTGRAGRKFWAELKLKNEYDIRAYNFELQLPAGVTIATDEDGNYIYELGDRHEDTELTLNYDETSSTYYMSVIDDIAAGDGVIWKLNLKVTEGLALGDYPVVFSNVKYTPAGGQDTQAIPDATCRLIIVEHGYMKGDANDDDIVNIADVVCIVNHSVHIDMPIFVETSADVTGNGDADLSDAVKIIDYIVGRIDDLTYASAMARAFKAPAMATALKVQSVASASGLSVGKRAPVNASDVSTLENAIYADDLIVKPGQTCPLTISLKNSKQTNGYQFQLVLPEGVTVPKDDNGKYSCELSSRHQGHKVEINYKDGAYKILVYSQSSKALTDSDGDICAIQLQVADNMADGDYTATIKEGAYSLVSGASWVSLPKTDIRLSVGNSVMGDANGDGTVDIADAVCIVNHIVGKPNTTFIEAAADANGDGDIDIADAVHIVNYVVGKINALARQRGTMELEPE